jgi:bidirectional [NiFe] hydrogenase diaphorase subunit
LLKDLEDGLHIQAGAVTPDGQLGLQVARCIGACGLAPVVVLDEDVLPKATGQEVLAAVEHLLTSKLEEGGSPQLAFPR